LIFLTYLIQPFVNAIICKSRNILKYVYLKRKSYIIPNGIFLERINYFKKGYRKELGLNAGKKYVLFLGDTLNKRKNYPLLKQSFEILDFYNSELITPYPISHDNVIKYLNSVDVVVVPSFMEGSPNVVKEAMACNCPVVATDVGDVKWLFGNEPGHFLTSFDPADVAEKIGQALEFSEKYGRTNGRNRILELELDAERVSRRVVRVYEEVLLR
jgi:glycosyltransferase involved in cell wall biosynthesis